MIPPAMAAGRILIVDDDPGVRVAVSAALKSAGYETRLARHGVEALNALRSQGADLVLLDLVMDTMTGAEFLEVKAADPGLAGIPVIAMSGHLATPHLTDVSWVLQKPIDLDQLLSHVHAALRTPKP